VRLLNSKTNRLSFCARLQPIALWPPVNKRDIHSCLPKQYGVICTRGQHARRNIPPAIHTRFWRQRWENIEYVVGALVEDFIVFLVLIAGLSVAYLLLGILAALGYDSKRIETFESIHYWAYLAVFGFTALHKNSERPAF
jgi:hypothetical protein